MSAFSDLRNSSNTELCFTQDPEIIKSKVNLTDASRKAAVKYSGETVTIETSLSDAAIYQTRTADPIGIDIAVSDATLKNTVRGEGEKIGVRIDLSDAEPEGFIRDTSQESRYRRFYRMGIAEEYYGES